MLPIDVWFEIAIMCDCYADYLEIGAIVNSLLDEERCKRARVLLTKYVRHPHNYETWTLDGRHHRENDLPAVIMNNNTYKLWLKHGKFHRDGDLPALIDGDNHLEWYQNNELHREGGLPAYIRVNTESGTTTKYWYIHGVRKKKEKIYK
jgi:hypothetical protein